MSCSVVRIQGAALALAACLLVGAGCKSHSQPKGSPADAVIRYFQAMHARDCESARKYSGDPLRSRLIDVGCEAAFDEFAGHGTRISAIESARPDGRDQSVILVRARLALDGADKPVVISVRAQGDRWVVTDL